MLYTVTVLVLIGGVLAKYKFYNTRIENSDLSIFETRKELESSFILTLNLYVSHYSLKVFDLCDSITKDMVTSDSYSQSNMKVSCVQVSDTSKKQKAATNEY